jgi:hypothetical protein
MLFVLFLLVWWLAHLAASCMHHGCRDRYDRHDRRDKGIFRIGRLYLLDIERRTLHTCNLKIIYSSTYLLQNGSSLFVFE